MLLKLTWRESNAVTLGIQQSSDLHQVTPTFDYVVDTGRLHHEGVRSLALLVEANYNNGVFLY